MHIVLTRRRGKGPQRKSLITLPNNPLDNLTRQYIHNGTGNLRLLAAISRDAFSSSERKECENLAFHRFELVRVFFCWHLDKSLLSAFSAEIVMILAAGEEEKILCLH